MWSLLTLIVYIVTCSPACRGQEGDSSCEYSYLVQPPRELPCNPFQTTANEHNVTKRAYNVKLTCVVAQNITSSGLRNSKIRWIQMLADSEPKCLPLNDKSHNLSTREEYILFQSELQMTRVDPPNGSDSYWCELFTDDNDIPCNSSNIFVNKLTIHESESYDMLPPCPENIYFHLAETVCVTNSSIRCPPNSNCSEDDRGNGSEENHTVIIAVSAFVGAVILLTLVVIVACVLRRVRRKDKQQQKRNTKTESAASIVPPVIDQEHILTPPTSAPPIFREENGMGVSGNQLQVSAPSPVLPQRPSIYPPTPVKPLKVPESARKRAISLLRRSSKGANKNVIHNNEPANTNTDSRTHEDGPTPRKKPYKTLELDTVEVPHLYMRRDKSPVRRQPPMAPKKHPQHQSRQKVLLTETMSSGYVNPGEVETVQQQMYKVIDPDTQDYLAVYNVPHHPNDSPSEDEQPPIYDEPRQFD